MSGFDIQDKCVDAHIKTTVKMTGLTGVKAKLDIRLYAGTPCGIVFNEPYAKATVCVCACARVSSHVLLHVCVCL